MLKIVLLLNIFVETVINTTIEKFGESKIIFMEIHTYIQQGLNVSVLEPCISFNIKIRRSLKQAL